jgi:hypothetical protein
VCRYPLTIEFNEVDRIDHQRLEAAVAGYSGKNRAGKREYDTRRFN